MTRYVLVVAALLLISHASNAVAAEEKKQPSKNAAKVIVTLEMLGINNKQIKTLVTEVDKRVQGRCLRLAEEEVAGGKVTLRYEMAPQMGTRMFELRYRPSEDSNYTYTAHTNSIMVNYRYKFNY